MIAFPYTYTDFSRIQEITGTLRTATNQEVIVIGIYAGIIMFAIFFIIPVYIHSYERYKKTKEARRKKNILTEILLKKEIEDEIQQEVQKETQQKK